MSEIIHKSEIIELLKEKTSEVLIPLLSGQGYKYAKSSNSYLRKNGEFNQVIGISRGQMNYKADIDRFHLVFRIGSEVRLPKYTKWVQEREKSGMEFSHRLLSDLFYIIIDNDLISKMTTYTPSNAQSFKAAASNSIRSAFGEEEIPLDFSTIIEKRIPEYVKALETASDIDYLFDNRKEEFDKYYMRLLEYYGKHQKAIEIFTKWFAHWRHLILTSNQLNESNSHIAIDNFNKSVDDTNQTFNCNIPLWEKSR